MKFKSYVIFFILFGVLADVWICCVPLQGAALGFKLLVCLPTAVNFVCLPFIKAGVKYTDLVRIFSWLTFICELPKTVFTLFSMVGRLWHSPAVADWIALGFGGALSLTFMTLIFFVTTHLQVNNLELSFKDLPKGFDGLRICQLSDFHLGSFGKANRYIHRIIDKTLALAPDVIFFTGDLVNFESREAVPYLGDLARLKAPLGIFAIRGNHDYLLHGPHEGQAREEDTAKLLDMERGLGWNVLLNSCATLSRGGDTLAVVGVENVSKNPFFLKTGGDLPLALKDLPSGIFKILLSHDPTHWRSEVVPRGDIELTLSGHTHGLKYKLVGLHVSHWRLHESGGIYTEGSQVLHVSEGLGSAFAFRLGGFPKIDILTLRKRN